MTLMSMNDHKHVAQIVTRRHPLAMALYSVVFFLGLIFEMNWLGTGQRTEEVFPDISTFVIWLWKWQMLSGGGMAMLALIVKPRLTPHFPDLADLLHLEGIAAVVSAFGLATYAYAVVAETPGHVSHSGPAITIYTLLVCGLLWRGCQALLEGRTLEHVAQVLADDEEVLDHGCE